MLKAEWVKPPCRSNLEEGKPPCISNLEGSLVAECPRATTESGLEKDVTVDASDLDQVFFVRHLKDGQHLVCLDLPTGKTAEEGLAQAISAVAQETVSVRAAIFWQHECLLYFTSSLAAKGLAVRGARRVHI